MSGRFVGATKNKSIDVIGDIYDAALDPEGWSRLPEILATVVGGTSANVAIVHHSGIVDAVTYGVPAKALERYRSYYHRVNPLVPAAIARGLTKNVSRLTDILPDLEFKQSEFYVDFARPFDTVKGLGIGLMTLAPGYISEIAVHRGKNCRDFTSRNVECLEALKPHLFRALQLRLRLDLSFAGSLGFAALDALAVGCIVCDPRGGIVFANAAAEALAKPKGVMVLGRAGQGLGTARADEARRLEALIGETAAGGSGGALVLTGPDGDRIFALVARLPSRFGAGPGHVLISLRATASRPTIDAPTLQSLFQLTPAEARLTLAILAGQSLAEIGDQHRVSENTLRTQLASVLRKTETANQRELVRVLSLLPPLEVNS